MAREYFPIGIRLSGQDLYVIWYLDTTDGVVVNEAGHVLAFQSMDELRKWAEEHGISPDADDPTVIDLDAVENWTIAGSKEDVNPKEIMDSWNLFDDVQSSTGRRMVPKTDDYNLYMKLLTAMNLPVFTPVGEHYTPVWSSEEVAHLKRILRIALPRFRKHLKIP
jgi:hypothetical protein